MKQNDLPIAKKLKSLDSDGDDEEPQNEPGTSSTSQTFVPMLPLNHGPAATSQGPAASANSGDENNQQSNECIQWTKSGLWEDSAPPKSPYPD